MRSHPALATLLALAAACGTSTDTPDPPAPSKRVLPNQADLSQGYHPSTNLGLAEARTIPVPPSGELGLESMELSTEGSEAHFAFRFGRTDWRQRREVWRADFGLRGYPIDDTDHYRMVADGEELASSQLTGPLRQFVPEPNTFCAAAGGAFLSLAEGEEPPLESVLTYTSQRGHTENGRWKVDGRRFSGAGLPVWPGERTRRALPGPGLLRFVIAGESAFSELARTNENAEVVFRIRQADRTLFERTLSIPVDGASERHTLELTDGSDLEFSVDGDFAYTTFFSPILTPTPAPDAPQPTDDRPDIIVFQADTFRADNLVAFGGAHTLAPYLEKLAAASLRYDQARSVSTYTLPAHATMFSGLFPHQAGMGNDDRRLSNVFDTLPELLSAAGYRTGAITESFYVSGSRGFAQGFEWFDELRLDMDSTRSRMREFLDADDGRPMFLFLQSYAIHTPYEVREPTREAWGDVFDLGVQFEEVFAEVHTFPKQKSLLSPEQLADFSALVDQMHGLYRAGVVDFAQDFEILHRELEDRGLLESGYFVFLSDHGEAFLEHENIMHKGPVFDEQTRIPLLVTGPGISPGVDHAPVSLIDFAPSLAHWAGITPPRSWPGSPFDRVPMERPAYVFECYDPPNATWAKIEGSQKLITYEADERRGEIRGAFDLEQDPGELSDLQLGADWSKAFLERMQKDAEFLFRPLSEVQSADIDSEILEEMQALGYAGDS